MKIKSVTLLVTNIRLVTSQFLLTAAVSGLCQERLFAGTQQDAATDSLLISLSIKSSFR